MLKTTGVTECAVIMSFAKLLVIQRRIQYIIIRIPLKVMPLNFGSVQGKLVRRH